MLRARPVHGLHRLRARLRSNPRPTPSAAHHTRCPPRGMSPSPQLQKWVREELPRCWAMRQLRVRCPACPKFLPQRVLFEEAALAEASELAAQLERRDYLQANQLYPEPMQVECPLVGCVGIGYLGFETIMCMICEEVWSAEGEAVVKVACSPTSEGERIKKCPRCKVLIDKDGGCDHMCCSMCKHEFYWSTLKAYR